MNPMKCKLTFIKLTLNLHLNTSKFPNLGHLLKKKHVFLSFFFIVLKNIKHILPGIDFSVLMSRNLMAGKPRVMQNNWIIFFQGIDLKSGRAQVID